MGSVGRSGPFKVRRVAIIGAGPSGLGAAKYLQAEKAFEQIDVFEQQSEVGGVWFYSSSIVGHVPIPQTTPHNPPELPVWPEGAPAPLFSNPMYDHLNTNIPKELMQFSDQDFLPESLLFPSRENVQDYLVKYSQDVRHLIQFSTQVENLLPINENGQSRWELVSKSTVTGEEKKHVYDAIVVANGHYSVPFIPAVPGIEVFNAAHPSIITHSKVYRSPKPFTGKKVVVVGNSASGLDIGTQISRVCETPLLNSVRSPSTFFDSGSKGKEEVPAIVEFLPKHRAVRFENGRIEKNVDAVIYSTGYLYSYPFLKSLDPPVVSDGRRVIGLHREMISIDHPTLAFTALQKKVVPFPLSEVQAAAIAKIWSNKLDLPSEDKMRVLEKKLLDEQGPGNEHVLGYPKDADYINDLHDWVGSSSDRFAKEPAYWGKKERWLREIFNDVKKKFVSEGEKAKTLEDLGFKMEVKANL